MRTRSSAGRRRFGVVAAALVLAAAVTTMVGTAPASAGTTDPKIPVSAGNDPVIDQFVKTVGATAIENQEALSALRSWLADQPGLGTSGYVGSIDDLPGKATTILWYGPSTPLLSAVLDEGARRGIKVSVQARSHSLQQLNSAIDSVWQQAATGRFAGFAISGIAAVGAVDDGLTIYGTYTDKQRSAEVQALTTTVGDVPAHLVPGTGSTTSFGRDNDFAPFWAGGYMISPSTNSTCSTGFAINLNGVTRSTTARHCTQNDYRARTGTATYGTGLQNTGNGGGRVLSASGQGRAWDGTFNQEGFSKPVNGFGDAAIGDLTCTGGGNSGEHCNIKVVNLLVSFNDGFGAFTTIEGLAQDPGGIAEIQGDSGGPVISVAGITDGSVRAVGMIQGFFLPGMTGASCGPVFDAGTNLCATNVLFSPMRTVVTSTPGASLLLGI